MIGESILCPSSDHTQQGGGEAEITDRLCHSAGVGKPLGFLGPSQIRTINHGASIGKEVVGMDEPNRLVCRTCYRSWCT